jgi:hypothetical protein
MWGSGESSTGGELKSSLRVIYLFCLLETKTAPVVLVLGLGFGLGLCSLCDSRGIGSCLESRLFI